MLSVSDNVFYILAFFNDVSGMHRNVQRLCSLHSGSMKYSLCKFFRRNNFKTTKNTVSNVIQLVMYRNSGPCSTTYSKNGKSKVGN